MLGVAVLAAVLWADPPPAASAVQPFTLGQLSPAARDAVRTAVQPKARGLLLVKPPGEAVAAARATLSAPPDAVTVSHDGGFTLTPAFGDEGRLAPREGVAGGADFAAFRFATGELARSLPVELGEVSLGVDNFRSRTVWPLVEIAFEDRATPLRPDLQSPAASMVFLDPASLPAPAAGAPDVFRRLAIAFPPVRVDSDLTLDDGSLTDDFARADGPLQGLGWIECDAAACPGPRRLQVAAGRVLKSGAGAAVALRTVKDPAVLATRPVYDRDLGVSVSYDVSASGARAAGIAFRAEYASAFPPPGQLDRFYVAEYVKGPPATVSLSAVAGGSVMPLGTPVAVSPSATGTLQVLVEGVNPVHIRAVLNGTTVMDVRDSSPLLNFGGWLVGLASLDASSSGETWDDFRVTRNPDVFVVIQYPPGVDAALPGERSPAALPYGSVLFSTDGLAWSPVPLEPGCGRPPNGFAQLRAEDVTADGSDDVFRVEYKLDAIGVDCPTCLTRDNSCRANPSPNDATAPVLEVGKPADIAAWWWNEHAADLDSVLVRLLVYAGDCFLGPPIAAQDTIVADPGQMTAGGPVHATAAAPMLRWTPGQTGTYCIAALELYDLNRDGCPDGFESGGGCLPVANPDQNFTTQGLYRRVEVYPVCAPLATSNLAPGSLRAAKSLAVTGEEEITWGREDTTQLPGTYNVHATSIRAELDPPYLRRFVPVFAEVVGATTLRERLPAPDPGVLFVAVFQNDGCASARSLPDP